MAIAHELNASPGVARRHSRGHRRGTDGEGWNAEILRELSAVDELVLAEVSVADPFVDEVIRHLLLPRGKRLRATLALLTASLHDRAGDAIQAAAAVELLHLASLCHDDVVDQAPRRRGVPSLNARWGNEVATFAGAFLMARATDMFARLGAEPNRIASAATSRLWRGQMMEAELVYQLDLDRDRRIRIAADKTGALYELPCRLGAWTGGLDATHARRLAAFGLDVGIAFQIMDDVLDILAPTAHQGKVRGSDLREGVYTLPVIDTLAGECCGGVQLRRILARGELDDSELAAALAIVQNNGSTDRAVATAHEHVASAKRHLSGFSGGARAALGTIADLVVAPNRAGVRP